MKPSEITVVRRFRRTLDTSLQTVAIHVALQDRKLKTPQGGIGPDQGPHIPCSRIQSATLRSLTDDPEGRCHALQRAPVGRQGAQSWSRSVLAARHTHDPTRRLVGPPPPVDMGADGSTSGNGSFKGSPCVGSARPRTVLRPRRQSITSSRRSAPDPTLRATFSHSARSAMPSRHSGATRTSAAGYGVEISGRSISPTVARRSACDREIRGGGGRA
jgi:hypothetical protein